MTEVINTIIDLHWQTRFTIESCENYYSQLVKTAAAAYLWSLIHQLSASWRSSSNFALNFAEWKGCFVVKPAILLAIVGSFYSQS